MNKKALLRIGVFAAGAICFTAFGEDAYIESTGTQAINLGRKMTPQTRWEVDFAFTDVTAQQRLFGVSSGAGQLALYISGGNVFSFGASLPTAGGYPTAVAADTARHLAIGDGTVGRGYIVTAGVTNGTSSAFLVAAESEYPRAVCAYASNAAGTEFGLGKNLMRFKKTYVFFGRVAGQRVHGGVQTGKTALFRFFNPFFRIIVAVENNPLVIMDCPDDQIVEGSAEIGGIFKFIRKLTQAFRHDCIEHNVGIGNGVG